MAKWSDPLVQTTFIFLTLVSGTALFVGEVGFMGCRYYQGRKRSNAMAFWAEGQRAGRQHRVEDERRNLQACINLAPDLLGAYLELAQNLYKPDASEAADQCMEQMLASNPGKAEALVVQGRFYLMTQRPDLAEKSAHEALALSPNEAEAMLLAAQCAATRKQYRRVIEVAEKFKEYYQGFPEIYSLAADAQVQLGNASEAIEWLRDGVRVSPKDEGMLWRLGNLLIEQNYFHALEQVVQVMRDIPRAKPQADYLQARSDFVQGHWLVACEEFKALRPEFAAQPLVLAQLDAGLADCYQQMGDTELQLTAVQSAAKDYPAALSLRYAVVSALLATGRTNEAIAELRELMKQPEMAHDAPLQLARLTLVKNLNLEPSKRSWKEVEQAIAAAERIVPRPALVDILKAEMLFARDRPGDAERTLREAQRQRPEELSFRLALVAVAARQRDWPRAFQCLDQAKARLGDSVPLRLARAATFVMQLGSGANQRLRHLSEHTGRLPERDLVPLWRGLAMISLRVGHTALAEKLYRQVLARVPNNSEGWRFLLELAQAKHDAKTVEALLTQIEETEGHGPHWHYGRAVLFRLRGEGNRDLPLLEKAQRHLASARLLRPSWPNIALLAADIDDLQGNEQSATSNYLLAIRLGEGHPNTIRRIMSFLWERQRFAEVEQVMTWMRRKQSAVLTDLVQSGGDLTLRMNDFSQAQAPAEAAAARSPGSLERIWWAQVLEILGAAAEVEHRPADARGLFTPAEAALRRGVQGPDARPLDWAALIQFLSRQQRKGEALEAIAQARRQLPPDAAPLLPAESYEGLGDLDAAEKEYRAQLLSESAPGYLDRCADFYVRWKRTKQLDDLLADILAGRRKASSAAVAWARRRHARELAQSGTPQGHAEALRLLEQNLQSSAASPEDRATQVLVLAYEGNPESRLEAIRVLEKMRQEQRSLGPENQLLLGQLYLANGDWPHAAQEMRGLLVYHGDEPRYLNTFISALLERRELTEAENWLEWLETLVPEQSTTVVLRAEDLYLRGRFEQAAKLLQEFLERPDAQPANRSARLGMLAACLQGFAGGMRGTNTADAASVFRRPAEAMRRELLPNFPEQGVPLAALLADEGRLAEALELLEKSAAKATPEAVQDAVLTLLQAGCSPPQLERLEKLLRSSIRERKRPPALLTALSHVLTAQKRYREGMSLLREVLEHEPKNVDALRDLATQLALERIKLSEAQRLVQRAIEIAGPSPALLDARALVYLSLSQPDKACRDLETALRQQPHPVYFYHYWRACVAQGEEKLAGAALAKARSYGLRPELVHPLERAKVLTLSKG